MNFGIRRRRKESSFHVVVPESMGHEKVCGKGCTPPQNTQRCVTSAEKSVTRSLTST